VANVCVLVDIEVENIHDLKVRPIVIVFMASAITPVAVVILVALPVLLGDGDCGREGQRQNCRRCGSKPALG
jgi:hypothetical protein